MAGFSPEIARVTPDGTVVTQPLAGTRALDGSPLFDAARCDELYRDATEVFEHAPRSTSPPPRCPPCALARTDRRRRRCGACPRTAAGGLLANGCLPVAAHGRSGWSR
ncbi:hypothetical protein ACN28G_14300 [Micromonospora sp. WMMA1923]|uniref:hypothetical protein n=1 Tax=Micromonospora sp. WMMA1923 TaxID=3404125 RepID=UPI003B92968A